MATLRKILKRVNAINDWVGNILSYGILVIFLLLIVEVVRRYFFNSPTVWGNELVQLIFGMYVVLSGGYILKWRGHVNVDLLYSRLSPRWKALLDVITFFLFLLFCGMLLFYGGSLAWESLSTLEHSQSAWNPPLYPFKLMIPFGALLLLLQGCTKLVDDVLILVTGQPVDDREAGGEQA